MYMCMYSIFLWCNNHVCYCTLLFVIGLYQILLFDCANTCVCVSCLFSSIGSFMESWSVHNYNGRINGSSVLILGTFGEVRFYWFMKWQHVTFYVLCTISTYDNAAVWWVISSPCDYWDILTRMYIIHAVHAVVLVMSCEIVIIIHVDSILARTADAGACWQLCNTRDCVGGVMLLYKSRNLFKLLI